MDDDVHNDNSKADAGNVVPYGSSRKKRLHMRPEDDDEEQGWWLASTAIPLLAATTGPLANVMSIAALVTPWRNSYDPAKPGIDAASIGFPDPRWCLGLNGASLACGFVGNVFLLFNFTRRIRYIVALPMTILLWYFATGIVNQGYWHAVIAAVLYLISSMILMVNMLGYFLGHYPQHFELSDEQRNLILQTMIFFIWLGGGAGVFARTEGWSFADALYFCDVTILTVGFGDFTPLTNSGRGLVFPYSIGGIIILGLMVSSIHRFAKELGSSHVVKDHAEKKRTQMLDQSAADEREYREMQAETLDNGRFDLHNTISAPFDRHKLHSNLDLEQEPDPTPANYYQNSRSRSRRVRLQRLNPVRSRKPKIQLLKEEKDRFDAMRAIQRRTHNFKRYSALIMSVIAFGLLCCVGAVGFWRAEQKSLGLSYFQALYFCYVSLLTIGYGDLSPKSNAGKPFFIVWSLMAVPTMTILIGDMGDTVIASLKRGTFRLADWTVLPKAGVWRDFCDTHPWLQRWMQRRQEKRAEKEAQSRVVEGFHTGPAEGDPDAPGPTLEDVASLDNLDDHALARKLALAIRRVANNIGRGPPRRYTYEEWAQYTRLIRFTKIEKEDLQDEEQDLGLVEWDWLAEDSPLMSEKSESEWILDRLCESLDRYMLKQRFPVRVEETTISHGVERTDHSKKVI